MAADNQGKGGKPAKKANPEKAGKGSASAGGIKSKQIILVAVLLVLAIIVLIVYVFNGSSDSGGGRADVRPRTQQTYEPDLSGQTAGPRTQPPAAAPVAQAPATPQTQMPAAPPAVERGSTSAVAPPPQPTPVLTPVPVKTMELSMQARALITSEEEFLKRYDETVKSGKWSDLAKWALRKELHVEAYRMAAIEGSVGAVPKFHPSQIMGARADGTWLLMNQKAVERGALKATVKDYSYAKVVSQLDEIQADGKISTLSRLSGLLVQADCPKGRELYAKSIKVKEFYEILARSLTQAYLSDIGPENASQGSWFNSVPMNLWLIEQLIAYDPVAAGTSGKPAGDANATTGTSGSTMPGQPPMGPGFMPPGGPGQSAQVGPNEGLLAHRLLLLQILARRGGEVSSYLIGKLLDADREEVLFNGILAGKVNMGLFYRFTGPYAEPLVEPFARGLEKRKSTQQEWTGLARVMASMFNDRASNVIFTGAQDNNLTLSSDLVFFLAAGGSKYSLKNLSDFIRTSRAQSPDITKIFGLWTEVSLESKQSFWNLFSDFIPSGGPAGKSGKQADGPPGMTPGMTPPPGFTQMPGQQPGMPGPGMPPGMGQQATKLPTRGWPVARTFASTVDAASAKEFLKIVGQMAVAAPESPKPNSMPGGMPPGMPMGPGPMGPGGPGMGNNAAPDLTQVKLDAVRCLVSLYDPQLRDYFRGLIDDANAGWMGRLGLCALDDRECGALLLKHFWKSPWELGPSSGTANQNNPGYGNNQNQQPVAVTSGSLSVSLDAMGLASTGISARDALIYFNHQDAGKAFLASLGEFIVHKEPFDDPERVADAACRMIEALGHWSTAGSAATLADLIESTGDFGLRSAVRTTDVQASNPMATKVRMKALGVLGQIGNDESLEVIVRIATYSKENDPIGLAARSALARRGAADGVDLFLDMIDPAKAPKNEGQQGYQNYQSPSSDPNQPSKQQIALLGLSRAKLNETQVNRAIGLIKKFGEAGQTTNQPAGMANLQEDLVLSLLAGARGPVLRSLASLIAETPVKQDNPGTTQEVYYWNRQDGGSLDKKFMKMVNALYQVEKFEDEEAAVQFLTAIIRREEALLAPKTTGEGSAKWDATQSLIKFEDTRRNTSSIPGNQGFMMPPSMPPGAGAMPPAMNVPPEMMQAAEESTRAGIGGVVRIPNMPGQKRMELQMGDAAGLPMFSGPASTSSGPGRSREPGKTQGLNILDIPLPRTASDSGRMDQQAALAAMDLISRLPGASQHLKGLRDLPFYRYLAAFMVWQTGDNGGHDDLVDLLAGGGNDKYLKFLAIEQLEKSDALDLVEAFAQSIARTSDSVVRARLADGAVYVAARIWENQMVGGAQVLKNTERVTKLAESWKPIVEGKTYDRLLADPMVIALAALESSGQSVKWMQEVLRVQGAKDNPVAEQAVGNAVTMLHALNPGGSTDLLGLYMSILGQTVNPERQRQALEAERNRQQDSKIVPIQPSQGRSTGRRGSSGMTPGTKPASPIPAYPSIAPLVIQAISDMKLPEALPALMQAARMRPDALGFAAVEIHKKDKKRGQAFFRTLFSESGKSPSLTPQAVMALVYLRSQPDRFYFDMLIRSITKADPAVRQQALAMLSEMSTQQTLPSEVNLAQTMRSVLQGMGADLREGKDVRTITTAVCEFADSMGDQELSRLVERIRKVVEGFKPREAVQPGQRMQTRNR